ncbi:MAG: FKBP-type peptidyl-prolyl cis-trans isomerase [Myxococcota bacterium]
MSRRLALGVLSLFVLCGAPARVEAEDEVGAATKALADELVQDAWLHVARQSEPARQKALAGDEAFRQGDVALAEQRYAEAIALAPDVPTLYHRHGTALMVLQRTDEALAAFDRALAGPDPGYSWIYEAHANRGNMLLQLGRTEEALAAYVTSLSLKPSVGAHLGRGLLYARQGNFAKAAPDYRAAARLAPESEQLELYAATAEELVVSEAFVDQEAKKPGAVRTASGLVFTDVTPGSGAQPQPTDQVRVRFRGTLRDGSLAHEVDEPMAFPLDQVIPCWTEGIARMRVGGKARLVCPAAIAYGERGGPRIPPGAALAYDIELVSIE